MIKGKRIVTQWYSHATHKNGLADETTGNVRTGEYSFSFLLSCPLALQKAFLIQNSLACRQCRRGHLSDMHNNRLQEWLLSQLDQKASPSSPYQQHVYNGRSSSCTPLSSSTCSDCTSMRGERPQETKRLMSKSAKKIDQNSRAVSYKC